MIECPGCGHENEDSAVECEDCGRSLRAAGGELAVEERAPDEMEVMLDRLHLPEAAGAAAADGTIDGAELFELLMDRGTTAGDIAALDLETLIASVGYSRRTKVAPGAIDPSLSDEEIARAILDYVRVAPPDTRVRQAKPAISGGAVPDRKGIGRGSRGPWPIQGARVAILVAGLVALCGPWGWSGGTTESGWGFALVMVLMSLGLFGFLHAGLVLYCKSVLRADDREWVFWGSRPALVLWLVLGTPLIASTNIRTWDLSVTWGAWLFLLVIALANFVEGFRVTRWGRESSSRLGLVIGAVWMCLGLLYLPIVYTRTEPKSQLDAEELLSQFAYRDTFDRVALIEADLGEADLPGIKLRNADLRGADLHRANLGRANLYRVNLSEANLYRADLSGADLRKARLGYANLRKANLSEADLSKANLSRASLSGADLSGANLSGADLSGASLSGAKVTDSQLAQAASLEGATMPDGTVHE